MTARIVGSLTGEKGTLRQADYEKAWGKDTAALEEYDYYLRGHDLFMRFTKDDFDRAAKIWSEGLAKFPNSPLLKVKLAFYYVMRAFNAWSDDMPADFRKGGELVREVLAAEHVPPQVARLAHWLLAFVLLQERNFDGAISETETAASLAPYDAFMLSDLSSVLIQSGKPELALEWIERASLRDPVGAGSNNSRKGQAFYVLGKYEQALEEFKKPSDWNDTPIWRASIHVRLGHLDEARAEVAQALQDNPRFSQTSWRQAYSYRDPAIVERQIADLAQAGLPAK